MRLLVADHSFVDANKRTALNTVATFYAMNGYYFDYDDDIRDVLKGFARGDEIDVDQVVDRFEAIAQPLEAVDDERILAAVERLRDGVT